MLKLKPEEDDECVIVGYKPGEGKYKNMPDIDSMTEGLELLVFNERARVQIGKNAMVYSILIEH